MDPDPGHLGTDPGSGSWKFIRILADPDPQHWWIRYTYIGGLPTGMLQIRCAAEEPKIQRNPENI
jgi:hypothetical protein